MPQFNFYGAEKDCICLLKQVLSFGNLKIVPAIRYAKPECFLFEADSPALNRCLKQTRLLYLRGASCNQPVSFQALDDGTFLVSEDQSGEMMTLALPGVEKSGDGLLLRPGNLSYPSMFWNSDCTKATRASSELGNSYRSLVKEFKTCLVKRKVGGSVWIGAHGADLLSKRKAKILSAGKWWTLQDGVAYRDEQTGF